VLREVYEKSTKNRRDGRGNFELGWCDGLSRVLGEGAESADAVDDGAGWGDDGEFGYRGAGQ
jgi:hypothetical protein